MKPSLPLLMIIAGIFQSYHAVQALSYDYDYYDYDYFYHHYYDLYGGCDYWSVSECWNPLDPHLDDLSTSIVPTYTKKELTTLCAAYHQVQTCVREYIHDCNPALQTSFEAVDASWHYLCVETKEEYLQHHRECLDNEELHDEGEVVCYDDLINHLNRLYYSDYDWDSVLERQCHLVNNYLDCVENLIISYDCGEATALWQRELDRRTMQPLLTDTGCQLDNSTGKIIYVYHSPSGSDAQTGDQDGQHSRISRNALIGCTVTLSLIVLAVGLLIVFKCLYNKKQQNASSANQAARQNNPMPERAQAYGYGGGVVAFGVYDEPLPGKDGDKGERGEDAPPGYSDPLDDGMVYSPPSQPPPYTGFPQVHNNPTYQTGYSTGGNTMPDIEP